MWEKMNHVGTGAFARPAERSSAPPNGLIFAAFSAITKRRATVLASMPSFSVNNGLTSSADNIKLPPKGCRWGG